MTSADWTAILTAGGAAIAGIIAAVVQLFRASAEVRAETAVLRANLTDALDDIAQLKRERDSLRQTLEAQTTALTEQSARLTYTINQLASMTLERDDLARQVATLSQEIATLKQERQALQRRVADLETTLPSEQPTQEPTTAAGVS